MGLARPGARIGSQPLQFPQSQDSLTPRDQRSRSLGVGPGHEDSGISGKMAGMALHRGFTSAGTYLQGSLMSLLCTTFDYIVIICHHTLYIYRSDRSV